MIPTIHLILALSVGISPQVHAVPPAVKIIEEISKQLHTPVWRQRSWWLWCHLSIISRRDRFTTLLHSIRNTVCRTHCSLKSCVISSSGWLLPLTRDSRTLLLRNMLWKYTYVEKSLQSNEFYSSNNTQQQSCSNYLQPLEFLGILASTLIFMLIKCLSSPLAYPRTSLTYGHGRHDLWMGRITKQMFRQTHCLIVISKSSMENQREVFSLAKQIEKLPTETKL